MAEGKTVEVQSPPNLTGSTGPSLVVWFLLNHRFQRPSPTIRLLDAHNCFAMSKCYVTLKYMFFVLSIFSLFPGVYGSLSSALELVLYKNTPLPLPSTSSSGSDLMLFLFFHLLTHPVSPETVLGYTTVLYRLPTVLASALPFIKSTNLLVLPALGLENNACEMFSTPKM